MRVHVALKNPNGTIAYQVFDGVQQFPLIAFQHFPLMSMGQFDHRFWFNASQMVIKRGAMSV